MKILSLPTPALLVDEEIMQTNMEAMNRILAGRKLRLRPHFKSNKCTYIAHRQMEAGAVGITCAKLSEAEDLVMSGIEDVLIANQIVEEDKLTRLAALAKLCRITVCVDSAENARAVSAAAVKAGSTVHILVEYEIGMNRCGLTTPEDYLETARAVTKLPNLEYEGIQAYAGHASHLITDEERRTITKNNSAKLRCLIALLKESGIEVRTISGGSTGTSVLKAEDGLYTELQAGSYLFLDSTYNCLDLPFRNSLFVLSTVVSKRPGLTILDVGVKAISADQNDPQIFRTDGTKVGGRIELNEEHLKLFDPSAELAVGEKVIIIPGHCCSTVNLYDRMYLFRGEKIVNRLDITARGKSL